MTITMEVTQEAIQSLSAQAEAQGLSIDAFLRAIVATQAAAVPPVNPAPTIAAEGIDPDKAIDELFDLVAIPPEVGEGAATRGSWYR
jgi:hypothetical protein